MPVTLKCVICGNLFSVIPCRVNKGAKYCAYKCHQIGEGRKGGKIRANQMKASSQGKTYPKILGRHAHRVTMEAKLGRPLHRGEVVHHLNENKLDYNQENLELLASQAEHMKRHRASMLAARKEKHGY